MPGAMIAGKKLISECSLNMFHDNLKILEKEAIIDRKVCAGV